MKDIYIERQEQLLRAVVKENNRIIDVHIEEEDLGPRAGEIYKGKIENIVHSIKSAFIDIGMDKNCYMKLSGKELNALKKGDEVIVEILKEGIEQKGAKVTTKYTLGGTYCVIGRMNNSINFSKRIENKNFIKYIKENINKPKDMGVTVRKSAEDIHIEVLNHEIQELYEKCLKIEHRAKYSIKLGVLYSKNELINKVLEYIEADEVNIIANNELDINTIKKAVANYKSHIKDEETLMENKTYVKEEQCQSVKHTKNEKKLDVKYIVHNEIMGIFDYYNIEAEFMNLLDRKISLNCGGHIIIEKTEAMYVIDVNSGWNTSNASLEETAFKTNIEALREIVKQIKLRNLSGIILIDFINMISREHKEKIIHILKENFKYDRNKTEVLPFTELNLVQVARRRRGKSINEYLMEEYNTETYRVWRLKLSYMETLMRKSIDSIIKGKNVKHIYIEIDPIYKNDIERTQSDFLRNIGISVESVYINFCENTGKYKVIPVIFESDVKKYEKYKVIV